MKAINKPLGKLEEKLTPQRSGAGPSIVNVLRERRRGRAEREGRLYVPTPYLPSAQDHKGKTIAGILRAGRSAAPVRRADESTSRA